MYRNWLGLDYLPSLPKGDQPAQSAKKDYPNYKKNLYHRNGFDTKMNLWQHHMYIYVFVLIMYINIWSIVWMRLPMQKRRDTSSGHHGRLPHMVQWRKRYDSSTLISIHKNGDPKKSAHWYKKVAKQAWFIDLTIKSLTTVRPFLRCFSLNNFCLFRQSF